MTNHKIVDVTTGEETLLDYTKKELDEQKAAQAIIAAIASAQTDKIAARQVILDRLGLTSDEAALLLS